MGLRASLALEREHVQSLRHELAIGKEPLEKRIMELEEQLVIDQKGYANEILRLEKEKQVVEEVILEQQHQLNGLRQLTRSQVEDHDREQQLLLEPEREKQQQLLGQLMAAEQRLAEEKTGFEKEMERAVLAVRDRERKRRTNLELQIKEQADTITELKERMRLQDISMGQKLLDRNAELAQERIASANLRCEMESEIGRLKTQIVRLQEINQRQERLFGEERETLHSKIASVNQQVTLRTSTDPVNFGVGKKRARGTSEPREPEGKKN
jgi:hypothetical protein